MRIFIMRHGEAEMLANSDRERHLTPRGQQQATAQGNWLKQTALFDKVIVSPYVRAQETFQAIDAVYEHQLTNKMETWSGITPNGNPVVVMDYLTLLAKQNVQSVLLISHLPLVGEIVSALCGRNSVNFYPATLVEVDWNASIGQALQFRNA